MKRFYSILIGLSFLFVLAGLYYLWNPLDTNPADRPLTELDKSIRQSEKQNAMTMETYINVFGRPHILLDDVCYYFSPWHPTSYMLKIHFKDNTILKYQSRQIDESDLHYYIPLLIEMLNVEHHNDAIRSLMFLMSIFQMTYPNGYGGNYMGATEDAWLNTPLEGQRYPYTFDKSMYQKWKDWYNTEAYTTFENQKVNNNKDFY